MEKGGECMAILQCQKNMEGILVVLWECNMGGCHRLLWIEICEQFINISLC